MARHNYFRIYNIMLYCKLWHANKKNIIWGFWSYYLHRISIMYNIMDFKLGALDSLYDLKNAK